MSSQFVGVSRTDVSVANERSSMHCWTYDANTDGMEELMFANDTTSV